MGLSSLKGDPMMTYAEQLALWRRWVKSRGEVVVMAEVHRHRELPRPSGHVVGTPWNFHYGERHERR